MIFHCTSQFQVELNRDWIVIRWNISSVLTLLHVMPSCKYTEKNNRNYSFNNLNGCPIATGPGY